MDKKTCSVCGITKALSEFYRTRTRKDGTDAYRADCKTCSKQRSTEWCIANRKKKNANALRYYRKIRMEALVQYGGNPPNCSCCGENKIEFLVIDHINEDGAEHRRVVGGRTKSIFQWLRRNNYPLGFQVLCHNCNFGKTSIGECPHELERRGEYTPANIDAVLNPTVQKNPSRLRLIEYNGTVRSLQEWSDLTGISRNAIHGRLKRGWSVHDALTKPVRKNKRWHSD